MTRKKKGNPNSSSASGKIVRARITGTVEERNFEQKTIGSVVVMVSNKKSFSVDIHSKTHNDRPGLTVVFLTRFIKW